MRLELNRVPPEGLHVEGEVPAAALGLAGDRHVTAEHPVRYALSVDLVHGQLIVRGTLETEVSFVCSKCAETFACHVVEPAFDLVQTVAEDVESVELTMELMEAIVLAFPSFPVCREGCKGLCPQCGVNRNVASCGCVAPADGRWGALDGLGQQVPGSG